MPRQTTRVPVLEVALPPEDRLRTLEMNPVSRETERRLDALVALLCRWQRTTNLVSSASLPLVWTRHIADSLQLLSLAPDARHWIDVGSGAGFPGMMVACVLADQPNSLVHLVESNAKKAAFLREAVRATGAAAQVHHCRAEAFIQDWHGEVDVVTARALASLPTLLHLIAPLLGRGATALLLKGQDVGQELTEATNYWNIDAQRIPSKTNPKASILKVRRAERKSSA